MIVHSHSAAETILWQLEMKKKLALEAGTYCQNGKTTCNN
jgi:hypothetical protein